MGSAMFGGRWNSKGVKVLYMSENRALAVLEVLLHLIPTGRDPDGYVLGIAEIPIGCKIETVDEATLPPGWKTDIPAQQTVTKGIGDEWVRRMSTAVLSVPSVVVGERNFVLNPEHPDYLSIHFADPQPFEFDSRLLAHGTHSTYGA